MSQILPDRPTESETPYEGKNNEPAGCYWQKRSDGHIYLVFNANGVDGLWHCVACLMELLGGAQQMHHRLGNDAAALVHSLPLP